MASFTAIETEYKGIVFRSKSEAMFAFMLDHVGLVWIYEPKWLAVPGLYSPDFLVVDAAHNGLRGTVVEYKPKKPTKTYLNKLALASSAIALKLDAAGFSSKTFAVVALDFYTAFEPKLFSLDASGWKQRESDGVCKTPFGASINERSFLEAKGFRFDLMHG